MEGGQYREFGETEKHTPKTPSVQNKLFQRLTEDVGHPKLRELLAAVVSLMKYSPDWKILVNRLDREFPQWGKNYLLPFPDDYEPPQTATKAKEAAN
jgi:hypothetical protein